MVDFLKKIDIPVMVRGVRSAVDWNFESELFQVHKILWPKVEMVCLLQVMAIMGGLQAVAFRRRYLE